MGLPAVAATVSSAFNQIPAEKKSAAINWLRKATDGGVANMKQAIGFAAKNELNATIVAEGLVRNGVPQESVSSMFDNSPNGAAIRASLMKIGRGLIATEDAQRPGLSASVGDTASDLLRADLVKSLVRAFGSVESARKVQMALATLRESDFEWYSALKTKMA